MFRIISALFISVLLFADYYTATNSSLNSNKTLIFTHNFKIEVNNSKITTNSKKLNALMLGETPKTFEQTDITNEDDMLESFETYNLAYVLKNHPQEEFVLKTPKYLLLITPSYSTDYINVFNTQKEANVYTYEVKKALLKDHSLAKKQNFSLTLYTDENDNLLAVKFSRDLKTLKQVITPNLEKFLEEKSKLKTEVDKFTLDEGNLYLSYVSKTKNGAKRLKLTYQKFKKYYIKTMLKAPISLFDPENKSPSIEEDIGFLREYKNDLYEIKKVQIIDSQIDTMWINKPSSSVVVVEYNGLNDKTILSKDKNQQFYGIEGVLYLVTWMRLNNIHSKIFTFINGYLPFDSTMKEISKNSYDMEKNHHIIYKFTTDDRGFVTKIFYPSYNISINLESVDTDLTLKNKKYLKELMQQFDIKLIKEQ